MDCRKCLITIVEKLFERCPLNYSIIKGCSALSPNAILMNTTTSCMSRVETLLNKMIDAKIISASEADTAKQQYSHFIQSEVIKNELQVCAIYCYSLHLFM
jgi:hypothetical protein